MKTYKIKMGVHEVVLKELYLEIEANSLGEAKEFAFDSDSITENVIREETVEHYTEDIQLLGEWED